MFSDYRHFSGYVKLTLTLFLTPVTFPTLKAHPQTLPDHLVISSDVLAISQQLENAALDMFLYSTPGNIIYERIVAEAKRLLGNLPPARRDEIIHANTLNLDDINREKEKIIAMIDVRKQPATLSSTISEEVRGVIKRTYMSRVGKDNMQVYLKDEEATVFSENLGITKRKLLRNINDLRKRHRQGKLTLFGEKLPPANIEVSPTPESAFYSTQTPSCQPSLPLSNQITHVTADS